MGFNVGRIAAAFGFVTILAAGSAAAHDPGPQPATPAGKAAGARHDGFKQVGAAFKAAFDEVRKGEPDLKVVALNAQKLNTLSRQVPTWFPAGSGPDSGAKTDAKAEVWQDPQGFAAAVAKLQSESAKLQTVAASGDAAATKAQAMAVGGACKNCHDKFRVPEKR